MEKIKFDDGHARKIYTDYLNGVSSALDKTDKPFRESILMEVNSHIFEAVSTGNASEAENIRRAISELGRPEDYLKDLVAEKRLDEALKAYNPIGILKHIYYFGKSSLKYSAYFVVYLFILAMPFLFFAKLFFPESTGLFYRGDKIVGFGFWRDTEGLTEVLHLWFYPAVILMMALLYFAFTAVLRKQRSSRKAGQKTEKAWQG